MTALFVLSSEYRAAAEKLADLELDEATIADTLEGLSGELEVKAKNIAMFTRNLEATAASIKDAEAQMAHRRKAIENRAAGLRRYLLGGMQHAGINKIEFPHFVLAIKTNPPAVDVFEPGLVPSEFMKQPDPPPPTVDKTAVKDAIKKGYDVPGCRLMQGVRLDIA